MGRWGSSSSMTKSVFGQSPPPRPQDSRRMPKISPPHDRHGEHPWSNEHPNRQTPSYDHTHVPIDHEGNPCETFIQGAPRINSVEKGGHLLLSCPELQGPNNYKAKGVLLSAVAHLWDDNSAKLSDVERPLYTTTDETLKEYEITDYSRIRALWSTPPP
jgi:hypothetical protein